MNINDYKVILGSSSPRRIEMFQNNGYDVEILKPECEENLPSGIGMEDAVMFLSLKKALDVEARLKNRGDFEKKIIVAADTIVYKDKIIGKPMNRCHAGEILEDLAGEVHYVVTGVSIVFAGETIRRTFAEVTEVYFKPYSIDELEEYLDSEEPYDKAGAYAIQGYFAKYIDHIDGDYDNIVGFPWARFEKELQFLLK